MKKAIIIYGNPVDGFKYIGPFDDLNDAITQGNTNPDVDGDWWVAELEEP